ACNVGPLRDSAATSVTAGLRCAPEMGAKTMISTTSIAAVAAVLHRSASAMSWLSRSAMMPEPTTTARSRAEPKPSATRRRPRVMNSGPSVLRAPDCVELALHGETIEARQRQLDQQIDTVADLAEDFAKAVTLFLIRTLERCGSGEAPVRGDRLAPPRRGPPAPRVGAKPDAE